MRVISGLAKGTILYTLEGNATRPTLDRVKEAIFNIIQMDIQDSVVLDLFSGSGALGIEALSRGAKKAVLCDKSKSAINIIKLNLQKTHLEENAIVLQEDYSRALNFLKNTYQFDLIFLDPPYKEEFVKESVEKIIQLNLLQKSGKIIIETDDEERILKEIENLNVSITNLRKYGRVKVIFLNLNIEN